MKKKMWLIPLCIVGVLVLLCAAGLWYMSANTLGFSVGRCLVADNGSYMLVEDNSPIVMSNRDKKEIFSGLETGDKILVLHDGVEESYPGGTGAKWIVKLEDGTMEDIPEEVISELTEMGWLGSDQATPEKASLPSGETEEWIGVSRTADTEAYQDEWGVKLTVKNITPSGLTLVCTQRDGEPTGELQTGTPYALERKENGEWVAVETIPVDGEIAWTMEAWAIPANEETEWEVDWSRLYGELPAGSYRISKSVMDFRGTGDYDQKQYYACFDILAAEDAQVISYSYDGHSVSLPYVDGWEYEIVEYTENGTSYGVSYRPVGEDGWIKLHYRDSFGVCGTGLEEKPYGNGSMGTYDNSDIWSFITFEADEGHYVATTNGVSDWWETHGDEAMTILDQAVLED